MRQLHGCALSSLQLLTFLSAAYRSDLIEAFTRGAVGRLRRVTTAQFPVLYPSKMSSSDDTESQAVDSLRSLADFHEGTWKGRATSFSVKDDVAAGILKRKVSPDYTTSIKVGIGSAKNAGRREYSLTETMQWDENIVSRSCSLEQSNTDVDSVDASYSLDSSLLDLPSAISGTDKIISFGIEHCLAASNDERMRCFFMYGVDQRLARIIVCEETRVTSDKATTDNGQEGVPVTAKDLLAINGDIDRIVDKITGQVSGASDSNPSDSASKISQNSARLEQLQQAISSSALSSSEEPSNGNSSLSKQNMKLLELASGIWLGDTVIRDLPGVALSPYDTDKGFGAARTTISKATPTTFADWDLGVQKVACRWKWNFGESVQQINDFGKGMGAETAKAFPKALSGTICADETFSRRIPAGQRMVYIDYDNGDYVGFLLGSSYVFAPRFVTFTPSFVKQTKPFFTEFSIFQSDKSESNSLATIEDDKLAEVSCSKSMRLYNFQGELKQGSTSFFTLKQMDA